MRIAFNKRGPGSTLSSTLLAQTSADGYLVRAGAVRAACSPPQIFPWM
jgi:hypothetical protein